MASLQSYASSFHLPAFVDGVLSRIGSAIGNVTEAQSRRGEFEKLNTMSDAELAEMNLRREDIVRHIFRDKIFI